MAEHSGVESFKNVFSTVVDARSSNEVGTMRPVGTRIEPSSATATRVAMEPVDTIPVTVGSLCDSQTAMLNNQGGL